MGDQQTTVRRQPFRPDIQGLRAVAVLLVVLYHAGTPFLTGGYIGVDVFFVISGFLITNHLLSSLLNTGKISFASFYAKRARRILPASLLIVVLTTIAAAIWIAPLQLRGVFQDAIATALYVPNLLFAYQNTDYLAEGTPSLFQHFWSLGVEEQFYLVWPALIALGFVLARRSKRGLFWMLVVIVAASFAAGFVLTTISQPWAFFSLPTRAWELGVGGLLAFAVESPRWRPRQAVARVGTWAGLAALVAIGVGYTSDTVFPGIAAAAPVAATAAIIYFGNWRSSADAGVLLSTRGMVFIGTISYSLYLVHWPALVIPAQAGGVDRDLPLWLTLGIAVLCVPAAWLLYRFVERAAQQWTPIAVGRPRRSLLAALAASVLIVGAAGAGIYVTNSSPLASAAEADAVEATNPPAFSDFVPSNLKPSLRAAAGSNPTIYADGCHVNEGAVDPKGCLFGDNADAPLVELFGDSHAAQWFPPLHELAEQGEIQLRVDTKSSCPSVDIAKLEDGVPYVACDQWRAAVVDELGSLEPDMIILANYARSDGFTQDSGHTARWGSGIESTIDQLPDDSQVYVMADSPTLPATPAVCLSAHLTDAKVCGASRDEAVSEELNASESRAASASGAEYVDLTDYVCSSKECSPISGDVLIYRDSNHLTPQFATLLAPVLSTALGLD
ncbi:acyltransferase [Herbiconiux sp. CPCC 203407]|uniref:Acyltransferase n=1 Tax=Herbiconiux oxytropis TaxID=2970915 RepID=A0AA41XGT5_9MICO|nr:acyltransferase family protein [Herbiconiux oxytropis]MCS5723236.1 acyltransferase [Herbiconiux oxytropis]MCS5727891.1 acyltransferase [Herbiconiux oxytropis]